jgi:hypothetical protein
MQTAMQELIYDLKLLQEKDDVKLVNIESIISYANNKLEMERKQHETTFHRGINIGALNPDMDIEERKEASKHYYNSAFVHLNNQNK